jgi:hypothetical protein
MQGRGGHLHVVRFACERADFEALRPSFEASLDTIAAPQR